MEGKSVDMDIDVEDYANGVPPPPWLIGRLKEHLPDSLPLLRRLQFAARGVMTEYTHMLFASGGSSRGGGDGGEGEHEGNTGNGRVEEEEFAAAYVDLSRGPETEMWVYCSLEKGGEGSDMAAREEWAVRCVSGVMVRVKGLLEVFPGPRAIEGSFIVGALSGVTRSLILRSAPRVEMVRDSEWDRWDFGVGDIPGNIQGELPRGFVWDEIRMEDAEVAVSRTKIRRTTNTMMKLPSLAIKIADNRELVGWGFLGLDGSLQSLHCELPYRGRGFAKILAAKLHREKLVEVFGDDGIGRADVAADNLASQNVVKSLGGKKFSVITWARLRFV